MIATIAVVFALGIGVGIGVFMMVLVDLMRKADEHDLHL
jgi:hypothetical protein